MRPRRISAACGMFFLSLGAPAWGVNCFQIWDASDNLVYQSIFAPFDLARPAFDRSMANLRSQGRTFIFFDTPDCAITGSSMAGPQSAASTDPASILEIRSILSPGSSRGSGGGMLSPTPGSVGGGAAAPAPQVGTGVRSSTPTGMGSSRASFFY